MNGLKKLNDLLFPGAKTYERVGAGKAVALGFQHAFAMSCATILVPLLTGLDVGVALLAAGLGTLVFHLCTGGKNPVFLGSSFAFIAALCVVLDPAGAPNSFGMNRVERVKRETSGGGAAGYFLTVPSRDSAQMHKVENLLCNIFDGGTVRVYFRFQDTGRAMLARHMAVKDDPLLRAELERILGKDCVKVQDVEHSAK